MKNLLMALFSLVPFSLQAQTFSCPAGQADVMKYFVMSQERRAGHFLEGNPNPIYTVLFPGSDFGYHGYWFWLKSRKAHGFDVKSFDEQYIYMRSTELTWKDNSSFKRFEHDLPIAQRCVDEGQPGPEIKVANTRFNYFSACRPYKSSSVGTAVNVLDAPSLIDAGGSVGELWTRILHYHYNCDRAFENCKDEEWFYLGNGYGLWHWKHFKEGTEVKSALMNTLQEGRPEATLPCEDSYRPN